MKNEKTGYPHLDKPWMKYYKNSSEIDFGDKNIFNYLKEKNNKFGSNVAESYYGRDFSYDELFYKVDLTARALKDYGVKKGDVVVNLLPNIPEAGQIWFATTELGAISDFIDPRPDSLDANLNAKKTLDLLKYENAKHIIALDACYLSMIVPIEDKLKELGIDSIIIVSSEDSMNLKGKLEFIYDTIKYNQLNNSRLNKNQKVSSYRAIKRKLELSKNMNEQLNDTIKKSPLKIVRLKDLIEECKNINYQSINDINLVNYIGHTSGTSGSRPKPITLTNKNGISICSQCENGGFTSLRGDTTFHLLPFFAPAGAYSNYLTNLVSGVKTIDICEFYINDFGYLIGKYKPNSILATPAWLSLLPEYKLLENKDLSFIKKIISCGDAISEEDKLKIDLWLSKNNSQAQIDVAHGMSEYGGCGSYAKGARGKNNIIGIPLPNTIYSIVDPNNDKEMIPVKFSDNSERIEGELVVSSPSVTNGVINKNIIVPHYEVDGLDFIRTRDLVEMDRDGNFYYKSRKDRSFVRFDGYKFKPHEVEKVIESNKYVKYARIVSYYDDKKYGFMPICHIVLENNCDLNEEEIVNDIVYNTLLNNQEITSRQIPSKFKIREELPLTKNNKIDFKELEKDNLYNSLIINVDVQENLQEVGNIRIYKDCKSLKLKL